MKLGNKIALISGLGCLALVGTGFAAWTFNNNANAQKEAAANVADATKSGDITVTLSDLKVTFDQASSVSGVHTGKAVWSGSLTATYSGDVSEKGISYTYSATISDSAKDYISFASDASSVSDLTWVSGTAIDPSAVSELALTFNQTKAPQNQKEYDAFKSAVSALGNIITFSFDATVAA